MKLKLKKIIKSWLVFACICVFVVLLKGLHPTFVYFALGVFVLIAVFILLGWDRHITYGDSEPPYKSQRDNQYYEDADDYQY